MSAETIRLPGLDGLRGLACLLVFFYHLRWNAQPSTQTPLALNLGGFDIERTLRQFDLGVGIFFVLSGLLLSLPYWQAILRNEPAPDLRRYFWRRACRIVPAYFAVLIAVYLLRGDTYTFYGAVDFLLHATFLHTFAEFAYLGPHPDLWTIAVEFQFYLLLPLLMAGLGALHRRAGAVVAMLALFAGAWSLHLAAFAALNALEPAVPDKFLGPGGAVNGGTVFSHLKLFTGGIAAAFVLAKVRGPVRGADFFAAAALVATAAVLGFGTEAGWRSHGWNGWLLHTLVFGTLAAAIPLSQTFSRLFSTRWLAATGTVSYGIYLWHDLVQHAVFVGTLRGNFSGFPLILIGGAVALAVTLLIAAASWRFIERDAIRAPYPG